MKEEYGHFYFKKTTNGNLIGEYCHNKSNVIETESASLINDGNRSNRDYDGSYYSYWSETDTTSRVILTIKKSKSNALLYDLIWKEKDKDIFKGRGMLCDNILIGNYNNL